MWECSLGALGVHDEEQESNEDYGEDADRAERAFVACFEQLGEFPVNEVHFLLGLVYAFRCFIDHNALVLNLDVYVLSVVA